ncbi:MAG: hypothetical protein ACYCXK_00665 [Candidatus Humimicrobiaceae bacterium]
MKSYIKKVKSLKPLWLIVLVLLITILLSGLLSSCSRPLVIPGVSIGYFIWQDDERNIRIAWSDDRKDRSFSGVIKTDGTFTAVKKENIEPEDKVNQSPKEIDFNATLSPEDYSDELVISVSGYSYMDFSLKSDGVYDLSRTHIGKYLNNPSADEFRLDVNYFENLKTIPWYNNHPFVEYFDKLYANRYLAFIYIYLLGTILIGILRITKLSAARKRALTIGILYFILFILDAGFIIFLWYTNGH